jgi:hypothetical protein
MIYTDVKFAQDKVEIYCTQCDSAKNIRMQRVQSIEDFVIFAFFCSKHDGSIMYLSDDNKFKIFPLEGMRDNLKLSATEKERVSQEIRFQKEFIERNLKESEGK